MFRVSEFLFLLFFKTVFPSHFLRYKLLLLPIIYNVSGSGDPRRGGANSRVQRSPQGRVERSGLFFVFLLYFMALEMSSSRVLRRPPRHFGVVSFFLSSSSYD